ncbi:hypothetical protein H4Q26_014345 [Puccinia striiformis f. sp. tritici PST-130]|nr:hypothetical protein Pst134EB_012810 [Puccinia striiformis f. sp. tritici]KAI9619576.1 hypothetical protein H4Q26_014345 [Puccinia striiformis f. sp. tritici PST-130]
MGFPSTPMRTHPRFGKIKESPTMVPLLDHVYFTGNCDQLDRFIYYIKDALIEIDQNFSTPKAEINWIARHLRGADPAKIMDEGPLSQQWWTGLLEKNARVQNLPTSHVVSPADPYVIPELASSQAFLASLQDAFGARGEARTERLRTELYACRQAGEDIQTYNICFNSLAYAIDITEWERCEAYKESLDADLLTTTMERTDWIQAETLKAKQDLVVSIHRMRTAVAEIRARSHDDQLPDITQHSTSQQGSNHTDDSESANGQERPNSQAEVY